MQSWLTTNLTRVFQPIPSWLNWRWLTLRVSKPRQSPASVFWELPSPGWSHNTNIWYSWDQTSYYVTVCINDEWWSIQRDITSSNQRLWECVRCRINVYPDTLNDCPRWLSTSKNQPCFINNRGFTERYFSDKVHASLIDWWLRCVTAPVSVDSHV